MQTFFFVPYGKIKFLEKLKDLTFDFLIVDLEDSVSWDDVENVNPSSIKKYLKPSESYVRIRWEEENQSVIERSLEIIKALEIKNVIIPKFDGIKELRKVWESLSVEENDLKISILIETPLSLIDLGEILSTFKIEAIGLGSHDFQNIIGTPGSDVLINYALTKLIIQGKARGVNCIDVACLEFSDKNVFRKELVRATELGFDGKFIIHPSQLEEINNYNPYPEKDILIAKKLHQFIFEIGGASNFSIIKIEGRVIEKPHLAYFRKIFKYIGYDPI
ncbi:MAG: citrate lyase subunit beta/citryl-CoA lyase [Sphingobacteriales bacterium]|jgi:citrate lyase subunit beta/citryl-CoA lyase